MLLLAVPHRVLRLRGPITLHQRNSEKILTLHKSQVNVLKQRQAFADPLTAVLHQHYKQCRQWLSARVCCSLWWWATWLAPYSLQQNSSCALRTRRRGTQTAARSLTWYTMSIVDRYDSTLHDAFQLYKFTVRGHYMEGLIRLVLRLTTSTWTPSRRRCQDTLMFT